MSRKVLISRLLADESGATAIEYGLIAAIMTVVVISIASTGGALGAIYNSVYNIVVAMGG